MKLEKEDYILDYVFKKIRNQPFYGQLHLGYHFEGAAEKYDFSNVNEEFLLEPFLSEVQFAKLTIKKLKNRHLTQEIELKSGCAKPKSKPKSKPKK